LVPIKARDGEEKRAFSQWLIYFDVLLLSTTLSAQKTFRPCVLMFAGRLEGTPSDGVSALA